MPTTKLTKALEKLKTKYIWAKRAIEYGFNYYVLEKPRGLDFSKRERRQKATPDSTGYALTSKKALENIFDGIPISEDSIFLDVGGGKAGPAISALSLGFRKAASLEYDSRLHGIASRNVSTLGLRDRVELIHGDAFKFDKFQAYSHIFTFNPIIGENIKLLLTEIGNQLNKNTSAKFNHYIIIYGGIELSYIEQGLLKNSKASIIKNDRCPYRKNQIRIVKFTNI